MIGFLAWRTGWRSQQRRSWRLVNVLAMGGVAFGVLALTVALAVLSGFEAEYERAILSFNAPIIVFSDHEDESLAALEQKILQHAGTDTLRGLMPFVYGEGLAVTQGKIRGIAIKAVPLADYWALTGLEHDIESPHGALWLGESLRQELSSDITTLRVQLAGQEKESFVELPLAGTFATGLYDYDSGFALIDRAYIPQLWSQRIFNQGVELWLNKPRDVEFLTDKLRERLGYGYSVLNWRQLNGHLFEALQLEKLIFGIIVGALILMACLSITGSLVIRILERRKDIAVLRALGLSWSRLRWLFIFQGLGFGWGGLAFGYLGASAVLLWLRYGTGILLDADIYFINFVPVQWSWAQVGSVFGVTTVFVMLATALSLMRLEKLSVIQALGDAQR